MWSVWPETIDMYLGQGLAMIQRGPTPAVVLQADPSMPIDQLLAQARTLLPRRCRLRIFLSGALCPAHAISVPDGVHKSTEALAIAQATAAQSMGISSNQLINKIPYPFAPISAAMLKTVADALQAWSVKERIKIRSIRPLWSVATECKAASSSLVRGLILREPDAITLLAYCPSEKWQATSIPTSENLSFTEAACRRWLIGANLNTAEVYELSFIVSSVTNRSSLKLTHAFPDCWSTHWSAS